MVKSSIIYKTLRSFLKDFEGWKLKSKQQKKLFALALIYLCFTQLLIKTVSFKLIVKLIKLTEVKDLKQIEINSCSLFINDLHWAILKAGSFVPWQSFCLNQALAAVLLLKKKKLKSLMFIGVKNDKGTFEAHTWVKVNNFNVTGGSDCSDYKVLLIYSF